MRVCECMYVISKAVQGIESEFYTHVILVLKKNLGDLNFDTDPSNRLYSIYISRIPNRHALRR